MSAPLQFFINQSANDPGDALVASFFSQAEAGPMTLAESDRARAFELHFLTVNPDAGASGQPFIYEDPAGSSVQIAVGTVKGAVISGTWTLTDVDAGETTAAIDYNASASAVQNAIRAGCSTNFSQAIVTGSAGFWHVDRGNPEPYTSEITADTSGISPSGSAVEITNTQDGTDLLNETWDLALVAAPAILQASGWATLPPASASVSTVTLGTSGTSAEQRVTWNADAYAGSLTFSLTLPHAIKITSSSVGSPTIITTEEDHGLVTGDSITISGHSGSTPAINSTYTVTRISAKTFTIPVNVTVAGTGGTLSISLTRSVGPVPYNASEEQFVLLLEEHPASTAQEGSFGVTRNGAGDYFIAFKGALANTAIPAMTASLNLKVPVGLKGTFDCKTSGVRRLLNGSRVPITTNLEIKREVSGIATMVAFRNDLRIRPELVSSTPGTSSPVQGFLQYNTSTHTANLSDIAVLLGGTTITSPAGIKFGGSTSAYPALVPVADSLEVRLADGSGYGDITARGLVLDGYFASMPNLPHVPGEPGQLWNDGGTLKISA